jgi:hypothetical protein
MRILLIVLFVSSLGFSYQQNCLGQDRYDVEQADSHYQQQNWQEALKAYNWVVSENPYQGKYWYRLGDIHYHLGDYEASTQAYRKAIDLGDNRHDATYNIGRNYALQNQPEAAVEWLEKTLYDGRFESSNGPEIREQLQSGSDLDAIRNHEGFQKLLPPQLADNISRVDGWRTDLTFMAKRMEQAHYDLFGKVSREKWNAAVENLYQQIPDLADYEIIVELERIIAMVGDSHTNLNPLRSRFQWHAIPAQFSLFKDGLFITAAAPNYQDVVGNRVLRIGNRSTEQAFEILTDYIPRHNEMGVKSHAPLLISIPEFLHALKLTDDLEQVEILTEKDADETMTAVFKSMPLSMEVAMAIVFQPGALGWVTAQDGVERPLPLWLKQPTDMYWFEYLAASKVVYFQFNQVRNKPDEPFVDFCKRMFEFINSNEVEALIIDMRMNGGGNFFIGRPLIHEIIKCDKINQKGKLFTIIGRQTASAAVTLTVQLEEHTQTLFVGEPTREPPNAVSEYNPFTLPYSGLVVSAACIYWQFSYAWDRRPWIAPDIVAELTSEDYKAHRDPAMETILGLLRKNY